jgi:Tol biopolymer transport system component
MRLSGPAEPVLDDIAYAPTFGYGQIDFSRTGTVVLRRSQGRGLAVAAWLDSAGATEPLVDVPGRYGWPRLSDDGRRLAMAVVDGGIMTTAFYERSAAHERAVRLPRNVPRYGAAVWTPDGRFVVMSSPQGLSWMRDGAEPQPLLQSSNRQVPWAFAPNGTRLAVPRDESRERVRPLDGSDSVGR